jgi:hypothetical protein
VDVAQFLAAHRITLPQVVQAADSVLRLAPDDVLFLSGSLVEGIGNSSSDLDLFLLTARQDVEYTACLTDVALVVDGCLIDVRVLTHDAVRALLSRFQHWAEQPRIPRRSFEFVADERKLLYRLATATPLHGDRQFDALRAQLSDRNLLRHKLDWARHLAGCLQVDLVGLRADGDHASMLLSAQEVLGHAVDALLAGSGFANPDAKWRVRYLSRLPPDWERRLPGRGSALPAVDRYLALNRLPATTDPAAVLGHVQRVVAFSRSVFVWAERALLGDPGEPEFPGLFRPVPPGGGGSSLPALDLDVDLRFVEDHFEIFRLNDDGPAYEVSDAACAALCLFDGQTLDQELAAPQSLVEEVLAMVAAAGFGIDVPIVAQPDFTSQAV